MCGETSHCWHSKDVKVPGGDVVWADVCCMCDAVEYDESEDF